MTTYGFNKVSCSVCGAATKQQVLMSTNSFGPPDLDLRPAEMERSTMSCWLQECPNCGFVSNDLGKPEKGAQKVLTTERYRAMLQAYDALTDETSADTGLNLWRKASQPDRALRRAYHTRSSHTGSRRCGAGPAGASRPTSDACGGYLDRLTSSSLFDSTHHHRVHRGVCDRVQATAPSLPPRTSGRQHAGHSGTLPRNPRANVTLSLLRWARCLHTSEQNRELDRCDL